MKSTRRLRGRGLPAPSDAVNWWSQRKLTQEARAPARKPRLARQLCSNSAARVPPAPSHSMKICMRLTARSKTDSFVFTVGVLLSLPDELDQAARDSQQKANHGEELRAQ